MSDEIQKKVFQYITKSNAAPFVSDTDSGFIEATNPMLALEEIVGNYKHPSGLFSAAVLEPSPKNLVLARYLSARAATAESAPCGSTKWERDGLYVDGKKVPEKNEMYELIKDNKEEN